MDKFVTIFTGYYIQEVYTIRNYLEAEGIEVFLKDEFTIQVTQYSNTFGGTKVQVKESDSVRAAEILKDYGYSENTDASRNILLKQIDEQTSKIGFIKKRSLLQRLLILAVAIVVVLGLIFYFFFQPSTIELLTKNTWCVDKIYYKGALVGPKTDGLRIEVNIPGFSFCNEQIELRANHYLFLPGIQSRSVIGYWKFNEDDNTIVVSKSDTLQAVYNGKYDVDVGFTKLILKSSTTTIQAYKSN